jgi:hypothetical protein
MAGSSRHQDDGLATALAIHLGVYCAAGACFALGLYALMQPSRCANPGVAAYKPPPGTVITYAPAPPSRVEPSQAASRTEPVAAAALTVPEMETTGRSTHDVTPETVDRSAIGAGPRATTAPPRPPKPKTKPRREVSTERTERARGTCIPGYDSAGAQTRPC